MTTVQQVMFELQIDYLGHPYYVTGNAILHAIADQLTYDEQRRLRVSHGMFTPSQFGRYPDEHSQNGTRPALGSSIVEPESYADLFVHRHPHQPWLLDSRPRDALNTPSVRVQSGKPGIPPQKAFGKPAEYYAETSSTTWHIHAYLHADDSGLLPLDEHLLDGLQFGGKRNYGYGETRLADTLTFDLDRLDYSALESADEYLIELLSPYVLESEHPQTDAHTVPWWWEHETPLRRRDEQLVEQRERYSLSTVDHGQVVGYAGDDPVRTAQNGVCRVGSHSKYGFGEYRLKPLSVDETERLNDGQNAL